ncbi:MAG: hypothetical protein ABSA27_09660 [Terriglobales bacterium]
MFTAVFGFAAVFVLCNLACISILRTFGVAIPFSFPFHFGERRERDLITSLQGRSKSTYIFVSGFLLFACPMFLGLIAYDRLLPIQYSSGYYVGTAVVLMALVMVGVSLGNRIWEKAQRAMDGKRTFIVRLKNMGGWLEQPIQADEVVAVQNEPLVFLNADGSIAGLFAIDIVESWREEKSKG